MSVKPNVGHLYSEPAIVYRQLCPLNLDVIGDHESEIAFQRRWFCRRREKLWQWDERLGNGRESVLGNNKENQ